MTHPLDKGTAIHLPAAVVRAVLRWTPTGAEPGVPDIDLSALALGSGGRVRSEGDFVFYNQPRHPSGRIRRLARRRDAAGLRETVEVDLGDLDAGVSRVVLAVSADAGFHAPDSAPRLLVQDAPGATVLAVFPLAPGALETAMVAGELARAGDGWEFRAVGRGVRGGLVALAGEFGVGAARRTPGTGTSAQGTAAPLPEAASDLATPTTERSAAPPDHAPAPAEGTGATARPAAAAGSSGYGYPQPDPGFTLPPQGPQFLPGPEQRADRTV
ncbi:TerD family protein [Streptomyces sp. RFCAC02]|uniref:TerD family protein n=1 Tax=Streptomyces sp. RFCAC02 TaxID=2499143 RepID=UPI00102096B6|nr:TerD family protein [Streptomyces sp. RFCAC02]